MPIQSLRQMALVARAHRRRAGLTQAALAERAGVSRWWISEFESGKPRAELGLVLRVLDALGLDIEISARGPESEEVGSVIDLDAHLRRYGGP